MSGLRILEDTLHSSRKLEMAEGVRVDLLTHNAHRALLTTLEHFGNELSDEHKRALEHLLWTYTDMALGVAAARRVAFPIAVGGGKTQSIVAWCSALYQMGYRHVGVLVAANKVEGLCDLKRDLIKQGIPAECIGLRHSYGYDTATARAYLEAGAELPPRFASLPADVGEPSSFQFLLVTHERLRAASDITENTAHKNGERRLCIWDESLIKSEARCMDAFDVESDTRGVQAAIAGLFAKDEARHDDTARAAIAYIERALAILSEELTAQREEGRAAQVVRLDPCTADELGGYDKALRRVYLRGKGQTRKREELETLTRFLSFCQEPLRIVSTSQGDGFITYDIVVPPELKRVVVLDASYVVRDLERMDDALEIAEGYENIKRFSNVTVYRVKHRSGRNTMDRAVRHNSPTVREVVEIVKGMPETEAVLVWTFKQRKPWHTDPADTIKHALRLSGVDVDATVPVSRWAPDGVKTEQRPRFVWMHWGQETSISKYSYCSNQVFLGVYRRSHLDLSAAIAGQRDNLLTPDLTQALIRRVELSEMFHAFYQAMGRGSCREITKGEAKAMRAWLFAVEDFESLATVAMPGLIWKTRKGEHIVDESKAGKVSDRIAAHLQSLPEHVLRVSTRRLKQDARLSAVPRMTWLRALGEALRRNKEWTLEERSIVRRVSAIA